MGNTIVLNQVIILLLIMVAGFYAKKRNIIDNQTNKKLSELLLNVMAPLLVISSFHFKFSKDMLVNGGLIFVISCGIHTFSVLIGLILFNRYPENRKSVMRFSIVFSNCGFMGFPVLEGLYGKSGIFYASIYVIIFNIFLWTYGVMVFTGKRNVNAFKKAIFNPGIVAVFIGIVIFVFSIDLPQPVFMAIDMVGSMTSPLSMLIVGALIADIDFKSLFSGFTVYYITALRLIIMPMVIAILLKLLGVPDTILQICVILSAMPIAANTAIFAEKFDRDGQFASKSIAISTVLSIATLPLIIIFI